MPGGGRRRRSSEWSRRKIDETRGGWQRNFDHIDFDLEPGMEPVTITVERGVTVTGRVLDPDGKPVAGRHGRPGPDRHRQLADRRHPVQRRDRQGRPVHHALAGQRRPRVQPRRPRRQVRPVADLGQRRAPAVPDQAGRGRSRRRAPADPARDRARPRDRRRRPPGRRIARSAPARPTGSRTATTIRPPRRRPTGPLS